MLLGGLPAVAGASLSVSSRIAAVTGSPDNFTDSGNGFVTACFTIGDTIMVSGFATAVNNGIFTITSVAAGKIEISETTVENEAAGALNIKIQSIKGGSLKDVFKDGVLRIYSGTQPSSADAAVTGTLLVEISLASGTWAAGTPTNGLRFGTAASGAISKDSGVWSGVAAATGTAGWFRFIANPADAGALDTNVYARIDGSCGTSGASLNMASTSITAAQTVTIDTFTLTLPASA